MTHRQLSYYRGVLLKEIAERFGWDYTREVSDMIHRWMKKYFGVATTAITTGNNTKPLSNAQAEEYFLNIRIYFSENFGWELREPNDPNIEDMTMKEFLYYQMHK